MSSPCCPTCNRPYPKPRKVAEVSTASLVDTSTLNLDELRAFYKRIGTREDCRFWLKHATYLPDSIRAEGEALLSELSTRDGKPADAKRLQALKLSAAPFYRQVCGHNHHTSMRAAVACKLSMPWGDLSDEQSQVIDQVLGWAPVEAEGAESC